MEKLLHHLWMLTKHSLYGLIIQLFLSTTLLAVESNAQRYDLKKIQLTVNLNGLSVADALKQLEAQTEFRFTYNKYDLDKLPLLSGKYNNKSLYEILSAIGTQSGLYFKQVNENISVGLKKKNEEQVQLSQSSFQVTGKVTSQEDQSPLPGVNIFVKGTTVGTTTAADGTYSLEVPDERSILVFSFIGYQTQEVTVGSRLVVDVVLITDITSLSEVVVVGYGTQRKSDLTGAVSLADPEEMTKQASSDVAQMMQGRIVGVAVTSDGQPGAIPSVRIRGLGTFGLGTAAEPLYVVDGFPLPGGAIRDINPNDIETMQVLKDATAGAIYGNRSANGVVIITTKGGRKTQDFTVGVNAYYGFQNVPQRIPVLNREGYQMLMNEALENVGQPLVPGNDPGSPDFIDDVDTDWQDEGYKDGSIQNYNLNFSGGTKNSTYYLSLDYLDNVGTLVGTGPDYKRYSFRVNSETQLGKFKIGETIYLMKSDEHPLFATTSISLPGNRPSLVNDLVQAAPTIPLYDPNRLGGYGGADEIIHRSITLNVPGINTLIENSTLVNSILANVYGEYEISKGLNFRTNLQYNHTDITDELFVPQYDLGYFFPGPTAQYQVGTRNTSSFLIENTLAYQKVFAGDHDLKVLVGQTFQDYDFREVRTVGSGFDEPYIRSLSAAANISATDNQQPYALASFLGRINYSYKDRYLLTFNIRRDGSSNFAEEYRYENFPSLGLAWKMHNDFTMPSFISELKLRGGIGQIGNQDITRFAYQSTINRAIPYQYGSQRVLGAATTILVDPSIQWETRTTRNIAIDAVLLEGSLEFTAEYYSNTTDDVLVNLPIPDSNGSLAGITTNVGSIKNSGIELSASYRKNFGNFSLDVTPNFYTVNNEVLDLGPLQNIVGVGAQTREGRSVGDHYGYVYDGIFQSADEINTVGPSDPAFDESRHAFQAPQTSPGDIRFRDLNNDGVINEDDRQFLGKGMPTYYYGVNIVATFRNFDFTIFGSGSGGNLINSNIYRGLMGSDAFGFTNRHEDMLNRWTPENTNTNIARIVYQDGNINARDSNRPGWLQEGDYFRINTISLGYTFPSDMLSKAKIKSCRLYATVQNVHTFTSYKGYNPDFSADILNPGFDYGTFPRPRTTMFGVQLKF